MEHRRPFALALSLSVAALSAGAACSSAATPKEDAVAPAPPVASDGGAHLDGHVAGDAATGSPTPGHGADAASDARSSADAGDGVPTDALTGGTDASPIVADGAADTPPPPLPVASARVVAYLPNYSGSYADWAKKIDFAKMTHLNLAFATANSGNGWDLGAADAEVKAIVDAAHAAGTKVLASLGGGGGDQSVIAQFKNAGNVPALVENLEMLVKSHDLDGVDIDIEDAAHLGADYTEFVKAVVSTLRPEGKLITAAVAQYLQESMEDATLHSFDFVNVMIYTNYDDSVAAMKYYTGTKKVPGGLLTVGAGFFGTDSAGDEYAYSAIVAADSSAWSKDQAVVNGKTVNYTGTATMAKIAEYSKGFGGIMFWELSEDTTDQHSLYRVIQTTM